MKRIISLIISILIILSIIPTANAKEVEYWYTPYLKDLLNKGYSFGYEEEEFDASVEVTAEDMMTGLLRIQSKNIPEEYQSGGAGQDGLRLESLYLANMYGLLKENEYTYDTWYKPITRLTMAYMVYRYMTIFESNTEAINNNIEIDNILEDFNSYSDNDKSNIEFLVAHGIVAGSNDNKFHGDRVLTEAEFITVLYRLINKSERIKFDIEDFSNQLSTFTTEVTPDKNRNFNINRASESCNGIVIQPGEEFSYYKAIGNASKANGYKESTVISGGKYVKGYGGGVCQNATTIFNAALLCNLKITERHAHGLKSSYVKPGFDATFASGSLDLRFINTYNKPIKIVSQFDNDKGTLTVSIYSSKEVDVPEVKIWAEGKGHYWTLYREVNGEVNYTTKSSYKN